MSLDKEIAEKYHFLLDTQQGINHGKQNQQVTDKPNQ